MVLNCCAADAQPVKVGLTGRIPPVLQPDTWLEVTGTYTAKRTKDPVNDGTIPFIDVSQARPVPAPRPVRNLVTGGVDSAPDRGRRTGVG